MAHATNEEIYENYLESLYTIQDSIDSYLQQIHYFITALELHSENISKKTKYEVRLWIQSILSNLSEIQKILIKKANLCIHILNTKGKMSVSEPIHFDNEKKIKDLLKQTTQQLQMLNIQRSNKNMVMYYLKKETLFIPQFKFMNFDLPSPWTPKDED